MQRPYRRFYLEPNTMHEGFFGDFEYVVKKKIPPRVCFGSGANRKVMPLRGPQLSSFMRRHTPLFAPKIGPGTYEIKRDAFHRTKTQVVSILGLGDRGSRFKERREYQPPPREAAPPTPVPQYCAPFNSASERKSIVPVSDNPAPSSYFPDYKKREMDFAYSFNGKKVLKCAVKVKCVPYNLDACGYCGKSCSAQGDYWEYENRLFLCRKHYNKLFRNCFSKFQGAKLAHFKSVRDCFFAHLHNSCKASVKIMKNEDIQKKLRKEAYLDLYFPQRQACNV